MPLKGRQTIDLVALRACLGLRDLIPCHEEWDFHAVFRRLHFDQPLGAGLFERKDVEPLVVTPNDRCVLDLRREPLVAGQDQACPLIVDRKELSGMSERSVACFSFDVVGRESDRRRTGFGDLVPIDRRPRLLRQYR